MAEAAAEDVPVVWMDFLNANGRSLDLALGRKLEADLAADPNFCALALCGYATRAEALNAGLWTFDPASFLPHGGPGEGAPEDHPIWVADVEPERPPPVIVAVDDAEPRDWAAYARRYYLFDASDPAARDAGRARWRAWSEAGRALAYWSFDGAEWRLERRN